MATYLKYTGAGFFLTNIPARDLTEEEALFYGIERLIQSGLYERVEEPRTLAPKRSAGETKKSKRSETADADRSLPDDKET